MCEALKQEISRSSMLREKLIAIFHRAATGSLRTRVLLTPLGAVVFLSLLFLLVLASLWVDGAAGLPRLPGHPVDLIAALPLLLAGSFLAGWSVMRFLRKGGTPAPFNPPPALVDSGPYAYSRNPMLTGVFAILFGTGFLLRSVSLVFIFTPLFIALMVWEIKAVEEPELEKRLGADYMRYRERVNRFWPGKKA